MWGPRHSYEHVSYVGICVFASHFNSHCQVLSESFIESLDQKWTHAKICARFTLFFKAGLSRATKYCFLHDEGNIDGMWSVIPKMIKKNLEDIL